MNRRYMLKLSAATCAAAFFNSTGVTKVLSATEMSLGDWKIKTISDGHLTLPLSFVLPDVPGDQVEKLLLEHNQSTKQFTPDCNVTIAERGDKRILFDAGAGANFMTSAGKLLENLEGPMIDPESITDVVFTHGHPDHLWGIIDDFDEVTFPNADIYFPKKEWEFWRSDDALSQVSESRQTFVVGAKNRLEVIEDRVKLIDGGQEILPGIEAVNSFGHTPGHTSYAINSDNSSLMVIGDALTNHIVSFLKPDWPSGSDQDTEQAIATRLKLLDRLSSDHTQIAGYHLPNGGIGNVEKSGDAYSFVAG